ncbi:hypothetical protein U1Q18_049410 [Sarracenia purpurea var. burkii]
MPNVILQQIQTVSVLQEKYSAFKEEAKRVGNLFKRAQLCLKDPLAELEREGAEVEEKLTTAVNESEKAAKQLAVAITLMAELRTQLGQGGRSPEDSCGPKG